MTGQRAALKRCWGWERCPNTQGCQGESFENKVLREAQLLVEVAGHASLGRWSVATGTIFKLPSTKPLHAIIFGVKNNTKNVLHSICENFRLFIKVHFVNFETVFVF
jgi:hypothetical protein